MPALPRTANFLVITGFVWIFALYSFDHLAICGRRYKIGPYGTVTCALSNC